VEHCPDHKTICRASPIYKANQELAALKKHLAEREQALGVGHEMTLGTVIEIGKNLRNQGKFNEAETYVRRALAGLERTLGRDHPYTLTSVENLRELLKKRKKSYIMV
jgi:hypothetical protein